MHDNADAHAALIAVLEQLDEAGYDFRTPTPSTVRRWRSRPTPERPDLRDIFGWGYPFRAEDVPTKLLDALRAAGMLDQGRDRLNIRLRVARVEGRLFLHSAFAGAGKNAVFVGPDSYRFAALIRREIGEAPVRRLFDIGTGAGVGAVLCGVWAPRAEVFASEVNPAALRLASANAAYAGVRAVFNLAGGVERAPPDLDLVVANPPYIAGDSGQSYKDGGGEFGERLALDWTRGALEKLAPGGRIILYTGSPIRAGGRDVVHAALEVIARDNGASLRYAEIDPDVFAGELRRAPYAQVERIAAVGAVLERPK